MVAHLQDEELNQLFRALGDTTRRDILRRTLLGEASVSGLAEDYSMSFAAVQKHVAVLERAGLVTKATRGRERFVLAAPDRLARARQCLELLESLWRHRLNALDDLLTSTKK
jgi:DNA-binding transcriptional ArsR family regulator